MEKPDAISLDGVARRFGTRWALRGVSLRAESGESLMLLGRNGSGKTTLLRVLATAIRPTRGRGAVFGHDLAATPDAIRPLVAYLGHDPGLYADLTARENLRFGERLRRPADDATLRESRIERMLERVGMTRYADERTRGFSAGMRRRVAFARALLAEPRLLLLDEPYAAFDAAGIALVNEVVEGTCAAGGCVLMATHDPERSSEVATRAVRMENGVLLEEGTQQRRLEPAGVA
ncbi:MAG TPA: heme ABC exporter ATP-binding protein CcmA [Longimicrobiales bacterium]